MRGRYRAGGGEHRRDGALDACRERGEVIGGEVEVPAGEELLGIGRAGADAPVPEQGARCPRIADPAEHRQRAVEDEFAATAPVGPDGGEVRAGGTQETVEEAG